MLSDALKRGRNCKLYCDLFSNKEDFDKGWVDETERKNHQQFERLEADFSAAKASMIKESVRVAYNDLGHHHCEVGNLQKALQAYMRTRDYISMPRQTEEMILNICTVALDLKQHNMLANYLSKSAEEGASTSLVKDKMKALSGLYCLSQGDFAGAARRFASIGSNIVGNFGDVLAGEDVAMGAVICGIAGLERPELRALVLDSPSFKAVLDLVPPLRDLLEHFLSGRYAEVKAALALGGDSNSEAQSEVRSLLKMDLHMHHHTEILLKTIQDKLVLQYFKPYNAIRMSKAVEDLYPPSTPDKRLAQEDELESHVWQLIESGQLAARIDAGCPEGSTLRRVQINERAMALQKVNELVENSSTRIGNSILRLSLLKNSFTLSGSDVNFKRHVVDDMEAVTHMDIDV